MLQLYQGGKNNSNDILKLGSAKLWLETGLIVDAPKNP